MWFPDVCCQSKSDLTPPCLFPYEPLEDLVTSSARSWSRKWVEELTKCSVRPIKKYTSREDVSWGFFLLRSKTCDNQVWKTILRIELRLDENLSSLCLDSEHIFDFCPERPKCGLVPVPHSLRSQCFIDIDLFPMLQDPPLPFHRLKWWAAWHPGSPDRHGHLKRRTTWRHLGLRLLAASPPRVSSQSEHMSYHLPC